MINNEKSKRLYIIVAVTVVAEYEAKDGGIWVKCKAGYYVNKKYMKFVRYI